MVLSKYKYGASLSAILIKIESKTSIFNEIEVFLCPNFSEINICFRKNSDQLATYFRHPKKGRKKKDDFFRPKVMWKIIGSNINFCYDEQSHMCNNAVNIMIGSETQLLNFIGLMNSKLYDWYLKLTTTAEVQGGGVQLYSTVLENIPVNLNLPFEINEVIKSRLSNIELDNYLNTTLYKYFELTIEEIEFIEN